MFDIGERETGELSRKEGKKILTGYKITLNIKKIKGFKGSLKKLDRPRDKKGAKKLS